MQWHAPIRKKKMHSSLKAVDTYTEMPKAPGTISIGDYKNQFEPASDLGVCD